MGFVRKAAKYGLFGLTGLAATGAFSKDKKPKPQASLMTQGQPETPSLLNSKTIY